MYIGIERIRKFYKQILTLDSLKNQYEIRDKTISKIQSFLENSLLGLNSEKENFIYSLPLSIKREFLFKIYDKEIKYFSFLNRIDTNDVILEIISKLKMVHFPKNEKMIEQGKNLQDMFFIKKGKVTLTHKLNIIDIIIKEYNKVLGKLKTLGVRSIGLPINNNAEIESIKIESLLENYFVNLMILLDENEKLVDNIRFQTVEGNNVLVVYDIRNPSQSSSKCDMTLHVGEKQYLDSVELKPSETVERKVLVNMPYGKTDVNIDYRCD